VNDAAVAIALLIRRVAGWFGMEGAWLIAGAVFLSIGAYLAIHPAAPWFVIGGLCVAAWLALTLRRP